MDKALAPLIASSLFPTTIGDFAPYSNRKAPNSDAIPPNPTLTHSFKFQTLPSSPMIPDTPPWPSPHLKSSSTWHNTPSNPSVYCAHFLEIASRFPKATLCYTDRSKSHNCASFAYSIDKMVYVHRRRNIASNFTTELQAIYQCLEAILARPWPPSLPHEFLITSDSLASLMAIQDPYSTHALVQRIQILLSVHPFRALT